MGKTARTVRFAQVGDEISWDRVVTHPLQSWAWGEFRKSMGIDVVRVNGWQLTFHKIPYSPWTIGYFPKGPTVTKKMIEALETLGTEKNAIFIQIEPNVTSGNQLLPPSHHPLFPKYTFVLDLTTSEEQLLAAMHSKTRYNIRLAQKHGVTVREDNSPSAFDEYLKLMKETTDRQGFYAHSQNYHRQMWKKLSEAGIAHLFTASYQGTILAAWIVFVWNDTIYYPYGASAHEHREVMAPNLMLWEIVRWAKRKSFKKFDLWGALGPNPDSKNLWFGFHRFKQGFNPDLVEFVGSYDLILKPTLYKIYTLGDTVRWAFLAMLR